MDERGNEDMDKDSFSYVILLDLWTLERAFITQKAIDQLLCYESFYEVM